MVTLHEPTTAAPQVGEDSVPVDEADAPPKPKRLLYLCRQHGHEPASTEGALAFIRELVKADAGSPLVEDLRHVTVYIVPMANPDGAEAFLRHNAHNVDLNRDWLRRTQPETQAWYQAVMKIKPDLMTDQHELYPDDPRPDFTETASVGCGASRGVIAACATTADSVQAAMAAAGYPIVCHWITDHHPARLAHRYVSIVAGVPTILFETNRLKGSGRDVAARGQAHSQFMVATLQALAGERPPLLASRHRTYQRPVSSAPASGKGSRSDGISAGTPPLPVPDAPEKDNE
jgi:hypothetical protein